jgi:hypothetical protein
MRFVVMNHQHKADTLVDALTAKKHMQVQYPASRLRAHFCLTDHNVQVRRRTLETIRQAGVRYFFQYPHTARPNIINDIFDWWPRITTEFVSAAGHVDVIRRYRQVPKDIHVIGWHLCPLRPFEPRPRVHNVLFGPIHPRNIEWDRQINRDVFDRLYKLVRGGAINLTVRHVHDLMENGLDKMPNVRYIQGGLDLSYAEIDKADVVVSHQTFAWLAVARGVPTVMMGEDMPTHTSPRRGSSLFAQNWNSYKDLLMYPLDILNYDDPLVVLEQSVHTDIDIVDWRTRMIGEQFDPVNFTRLIEDYCHGKR